MTIFELHKKLKEKGIPDNRYFLHGLYGSTDENDKISLTIMKGNYNIVYEIYYKEKGEKHSSVIFNSEEDACDYIYQKLIDSWTFEQIGNIEGLNGMTVNERLFSSGLMDEFDKCLKQNKPRAKQILRWLRVDEPSIDKIVK